MTKKKKLIIKITAISFVVILVAGGIFALWWFDSSWQSTPELALREHANHGFGTNFNRDNYIPVTHFGIFRFSEGAEMIYWSQSSRLAQIGFDRCRFRGRYQAQFLAGIHDLTCENTLYRLGHENLENAWRMRRTTVVTDLTLSPRQAYVNGIPAETIRFEVTDSNGITHNVQFWHKELQGRNAQFTVEYRDIVE